MIKKSVAGGIILFILLSSNIPFVSSNEVSSNNIIYVDDDGEADYTNIQDAINNASDGDTIYVYNGEYIGFTAKKRLNFIGENNQKTIIKVLYPNKVRLAGDWTNFTNFKINGSHVGWFGAVVEAIGNNVKISNCNISGGYSDVGIKVGGDYNIAGGYYNSNCTVSNCTFSKSDICLYFYLSEHSIADNCTFYNDTTYTGIYICHLSGGDHNSRTYHMITNCKRTYDLRCNT